MFHVKHGAGEKRCVSRETMVGGKEKVSRETNSSCGILVSRETFFIVAFLQWRNIGADRNLGFP